MKIKINPDKKTEEWHVGDVISDGQYSHIAMIIQNANGNYVAMDISADSDDAFTLEENNTWSDPCPDMVDLQDDLGKWHKVDATLVINGGVEGED